MRIRMRLTPPPFHRPSVAPRLSLPLLTATAGLLALCLYPGCSPKTTNELVKAAIESGSRTERETAVQQLFDDEGLFQVLRSTENRSLEDLVTAKLGPRRLLRRVREILDHDPDGEALAEAGKLFHLACKAPGAAPTIEQAYLSFSLGAKMEQSSRLPEACCYYHLAAEAGVRAAAMRLARIQREDRKQCPIREDVVADDLQKAAEAGCREATIEYQGMVLGKGVFTSDDGPLKFRYDSPPDVVARAQAILQELAQAGEQEAQFHVGRDLLNQREDQARAVGLVRRAALTGDADAARCLAQVESEETNALQPLEQRYWKSLSAAITEPDQNNDPSPPMEPAEPVWTLGYGQFDEAGEVEIAKILVIPSAQNPTGQKPAFVALSPNGLILCDDKETRPALEIITDPALLDRCLRTVGQRRVLLLCPAEALQKKEVLDYTLRDAGAELCRALSPDRKTTGNRFRAPELAGPEHQWDFESLAQIIDAKHKKGDL